jgi:hypothetical protein
VELALARAPGAGGVIAVRGKPVPPQTIEAGPSVGIVARELSERVLGLGWGARRRAICARRTAGLVDGAVYIR